jgi:pimeloyl-ACP methyl ester carboxylesterase
MSVFADDVVALLDHLGVARAAIGGMSMGGYVLLNLLERHPGRAAAALFLVTRAGADDDEGRVRRTRMARGVAEGRPEEATGFFGDIVFAEATLRERPDLVATVRGWMAATHPYGLEGGLLAIRDRKDFTPDLPLLDVPALVVGATEDRAVPLEHSRVLARGLPRAELCTIEDAGHMANLERPEAFNRCLLEFVKGLGKF